MEDNIEKEILAALDQHPDNIPLEQIMDEDNSPLNQPVVEKDIGGNKQKEEHPEETEQSTQETNNPTNPWGNANDAPEQEINEDYDEDNVEEEFELPPSQAKNGANALLGMANNFIGVGAGFFVKIEKHKEFYDFEEIIQVIDEQNEKNVKRIKLDEEDQALLRPLLMQMLQRKAKQLTPEQQLMGAIISILMKKVQVVMEIKAESNILVERILNIVREEKGDNDQEDQEEPTNEHSPEPEDEGVDEEIISSVPYQEIVDVAEDNEVP